MFVSDLVESKSTDMLLANFEGLSVSVSLRFRFLSKWIFKGDFLLGECFNGETKRALLVDFFSMEGPQEPNLIFVIKSKRRF